jgi:hypothetical protein
LVVASAVAETVTLYLYQTVVLAVLAVVAVADSMKHRSPKVVLGLQVRAKLVGRATVLVFAVVAVVEGPAD